MFSLGGSERAWEGSVDGTLVAQGKTPRIAQVAKEKEWLLSPLYPEC